MQSSDSVFNQVQSRQEGTEIEAISRDRAFSFPSLVGEGEGSILSSNLPPPPTDRGVEITEGVISGDSDGFEVRIHWLEGTFWCVDFEQLKQKFTRLLGRGLAPTDYGMNGYHDQFLDPVGKARLLRTEEREDCHFIIPGCACDGIGVSALLEFITWCSEFSKTSTKEKGFAVTRCDVALDVSASSMPSPSEIFQAIKEDGRCIRTRAKRESTSYKEDLGGGETVQIGSRSSETCARIYNRRGPVRIEVELKGQVADGYVKQQLLGTNNFRSKAIGAIRRFMDFVEPETNCTRATISDWWALIVANYEKIKIALPGIVQSLEKKIGWVKCGGAMRVMAMILAAYDGEVRILDSMICEVDLTKRDKLLIEAYKAKRFLEEVGF